MRYLYCNRQNSKEAKEHGKMIRDGECYKLCADLGHNDNRWYVVSRININSKTLNFSFSVIDS